MRAARIRVVLLGTLLLLASCATMDVSSRTYPGADLGHYRTYAWIGDDPFIRPRDTAVDISPLTVRLIRESIEKALQARGYSLVAKPDFADFTVAFTVGARDRLDATAYPVPYRDSYAAAWSGDRVEWHSYLEGTLSIDVFDARLRQPVWHGRAVKPVTTSDTGNPAPVIDAAVAAILGQFPAAPARPATVP